MGDMQSSGAGSTDAILAYWKEHREQLRQSETQRSTLTNFLLVIVAALTALVVQQKFRVVTIPLTVLIILLGIYGSLTVAKYYERSRYHLQQARALTSTLRERGDLGPEEPLDVARDGHLQQFPRLGTVRLHLLWVTLHIGITLFGLALLGVTIGVAITK